MVSLLASTRYRGSIPNLVREIRATRVFGQVRSWHARCELSLQPGELRMGDLQGRSKPRLLTTYLIQKESKTQPRACGYYFLAWRIEDPTSFDTCGKCHVLYHSGLDLLA